MKRLKNEKMNSLLYWTQQARLQKKGDEEE